MARPRKNPDDPKWHINGNGEYEILEEEIADDIIEAEVISELERADPLEDAPRDGTPIILETESGEIIAKWRMSRHYKDKRWRPFGYWATQVGQQRITDEILAWRPVA